MFSLNVFLKIIPAASVVATDVTREGRVVLLSSVMPQVCLASSHIVTGVTGVADTLMGRLDMVS